MKRRPSQSPPSAKRLRAPRLRPKLQVVCRVRPGEAGHFEALGEDMLRAGREAYQFSRVFEGSSGQRELFREVGLPLSRAFLDGRSGVVCVCGPAKSGKAHSLLGSRADPGLVPRLVQELLVTSLADHLVADYLGISAHQTRQFLDNREKLYRIRTQEDVFRCFEKGEKEGAAQEKHKLFLLKAHDSVRNGALAFLVTTCCSSKNQHALSGYTVVESCLALASPSPKALIPSLTQLLQPFSSSETSSTIICTVDPSQLSASALHLRILSILTALPNSRQKPQSQSPSRRSLTHSRLSFLQDALQQRDSTIKGLAVELNQMRDKVQTLTDTDTERRVRREVVQGLSQTLESMERNYKESTTLVLDTYQGLLAERSLTRLGPATQEAAVQCCPETLTTATAMSPRTKKAKPKLVKVSPISHHTRKAERLKNRS